jgi:predicted dehydrogenase
MDRLRVAVVGAGYMGQLHARAVAECDSAELAAVVDMRRETGSRVASLYGATYYSDVQQLLDDASIPAFIVALPDTMHVEVASRVLEAGKAVLLEKPMAHTLAGARQIAAASEKSGSPLMVGHILRFDPRYVGAAKAVSDGVIGEPVHVTATRFTGRAVGERLAGSSSVCFYLGVHDVDAAQWISGQRITRVYARAVSKIMPSVGVDSEDAILATCEFEGGAIGSLGFGWSTPSFMPSGINARLEVMGTQGAINLDVHDHGLRLITESGYSLPDGLHWPEVNERITGDLADEVLHFVTSVRDGKAFIMSVTDAMRAVAVNDAILRSAKSGRPEDVGRV